MSEAQLFYLKGSKYITATKSILLKTTDAFFTDCIEF